MTLPVQGVMARQGARQVGVRELSRATHEVLRAVGDGTRLIVTRHREPLAVIVSVRDACEALVLSSGELQPLESGAPAGGVKPWPGGGRRPIDLLVPPELAGREDLRRVPARDRFVLHRYLHARYRELEGASGAARLVWAASGRWLFVCSHAEPGVAVVHELFSGQKLERTLIGEELWLARAKQRIERSLHGRLKPGPPRASSVPPRRPWSGTP